MRCEIAFDGALMTCDAVHLRAAVNAGRKAAARDVIHRNLLPVSRPSARACSWLAHLPVAEAHHCRAAGVIGDAVHAESGGHWSNAPAQRALGGHAPGGGVAGMRRRVAAHTVLARDDVGACRGA